MVEGGQEQADDAGIDPAQRRLKLRPCAAGHPRTAARPTTSKNDGRKIAIRAQAPPAQPFGLGPMTAPRYAAKVKSGPGTAWAAPYPARNCSFDTQPGGTTSA